MAITATPPQSSSTDFRLGSAATAKSDFDDAGNVQHRESLKPERTTSTSPSNPAALKHHKIRAALGLHAQTPVVEEHVDLPHNDLVWPRIRAVLREPFAEFLGVFVMICFGNASVAQVLLSTGLTAAPGGDGFGQYQSISWG